MHLLLPRTAEAFQSYTRAWDDSVESWKNFGKDSEDAAGAEWAGAIKKVRHYRTFVRWPSRRMEYSFVLHALTRLRKLQDIRSLLDVASGPSIFPAVAAEQADCDVVTVDMDHEVNRYWRTLNTSRVTYSAGDMTRLPFQNDTFDAITNVSVLEHVHRPLGLAAIGEMIRVLRPGGVIIATIDYASYPFASRLGQKVRRIPRRVRGVLRKGFSDLPRALGEPDFYNWEDVSEIERRFGEYLISHPDPRWSRISLREVRRYWTRHWEEGLKYDPRRGRDYTSVGFLMAKDPDLRTRLKDLDAELDAGWSSTGEAEKPAPAS